MLDVSEVLSEESSFASAPRLNEDPALDTGSRENGLEQPRLGDEVSGPLFLDEAKSIDISPVSEPSVADVLDRALAKEAVDASTVRITPENDSVSEILSRVLEADESLLAGESLGDDTSENALGATLEPPPPVAPHSIGVPVQPSPLPGEDPLIPPTPFQPSMDFPYPEITGARMERFLGKHVLLVGGDERFQSDYTHLFTMVHADLLYFPSILQLEKQGMKRHVRDCDLVVIFGRAVNEPGVLRMQQVAEEYGRKIYEHPSSGLVSLYHRLQRVNNEI
jgi:hypothetical protein